MRRQRADGAGSENLAVAPPKIDSPYRTSPHAPAGIRSAPSLRGTTPPGQHPTLKTANISRTALPQPPKVNQKVPMASAARRFPFITIPPLLDNLMFGIIRQLAAFGCHRSGATSPASRSSLHGQTASDGDRRGSAVIAIGVPFRTHPLWIIVMEENTDDLAAGMW
jgi:hypothetical protein